MPCSQCNEVGHNVRTCPVLSTRRRIEQRRLVDLARQSTLLRQGLPAPEPGRVQHESVSRIVPLASSDAAMRHQLQRQLPLPETPYPGFSEERLRLQQERRERDRILNSMNNADGLIDHSLNQIISWGRRLTREIETRRELNLVETRQHIKLRMIDNIDDHFNTENCPVCLDSYDSSKKNCVAIECRHIVCSDCMIEIVKRKKYECPCCRAPFQELRVIPGVNPETFNSLSDIV